MTENTKQQLPEFSEAYDNVMGAAYGQVFFSKIAAAGFSPRNDQEAQEILKTAAILRQAECEYEEKAATDSRFSEGLEDLLKLTGQPAEQKVASDEEDEMLRKFASQLAGDEDIYKSMITLCAARAAEEVEG